MVKKAVGKTKTGKTKAKGKGKTKKAAKAAPKLLTIPNPLNPDESTWEIGLVGMSEKEFLFLWQSGNDRIGFNPTEKNIYDKATVIARIVREVKVRKTEPEDEEE